MYTRPLRLSLTNDDARLRPSAALSDLVSRYPLAQTCVSVYRTTANALRSVVDCELRAHAAAQRGYVVSSCPKALLILRLRRASRIRVGVL